MGRTIVPGKMKKNSKKGFKTVDICRMFDISKSTLFRWEKEGLISNIGRDWRNWRIYSQDNLGEIKKNIGRMKS
jgi:DNA-binding transcriptional MerR regulator